MKSPAEDYKNCFMNLALPYVIFSEPGPPEVTVIRWAYNVTAEGITVIARLQKDGGTSTTVRVQGQSEFRRWKGPFTLETVP